MKKIIHIDADCFFAALEMKENPDLADIPLAVGGDPNGRGVIATCNYMARQYGVRSAMASAYAKRLCPSLHIVKPNFELYRQASAQMLDIFSRYSEKMEPLSLDEAYIDVSNSEQCKGSATLIAADIRQTVARELGIAVSAGIAPVKFVAKIASDWNKPDGLFTVSPENIESFVGNLSLSRLPGVGKVTADKLARYGLYNCQDIRNCDTNRLLREFGGSFERFIRMAKGIDESEVAPRQERKSISIERTFPTDLESASDLSKSLPDLLDGLKQRYDKIAGRYFVSKKFVKLKFDNFEQTTVETSLGRNSDLFSFSDFQRLMQVSWLRQKRCVRLIGVGFRLAQPNSCPEQLHLPLTERI